MQTSYERSTARLKREDSSIRWVELLDKFKNVQERSRRSGRSPQASPLGAGENGVAGSSLSAPTGNYNNTSSGFDPHARSASDARIGGGGIGFGGLTGRPGFAPVPEGAAVSDRQRSAPAASNKPRSGLGNFTRLTTGIGQRRTKR